jgi:hypothetical protein
MLKHVEYIVMAISACLSVGLAGTRSAHATGGKQLAGGTQLRNLHSQKCVEIPRASKAANTRVDQWTCVEQDNERWNYLPVEALGAPYELRDAVRLQNQATKMCLTATGTSNGSAVVQKPCDLNRPDRQQAWKTVRRAKTTPGYEYLYNVYSGKCLDVPAYSKRDGVGLDIWSCGIENRPVKANQLFTT